MCTDLIDLLKLIALLSMCSDPIFSNKREERHLN